MYNNIIERNLRKERLLLRLKRLSCNKIFISNGEFKHTNNKVIITLYIYNKQRHNYMLNIQNMNFKGLNIYLQKLNDIFNIINIKGIQYIEEIDSNKYLLNKVDITKNIVNNKMSEYINVFNENFRNKIFNKVKLYFYYKQLININESKFNYNYLQILKKHLSRIFNKNIEFNLINLKNFYLNSDIISESIISKLRRNRRNILKYINILRKKVKIKRKRLLFKFPYINLKFINNYNNNTILKNTKYKYVTGFRLETSGRLTRRYTASRAVSKLRYKGNLLNIDSSYRGISSVLLKGNLKSNLQYTKLKSKTRIGSFGIKG